MTENEISKTLVEAAIEGHREWGGPGLLEDVYEENAMSRMAFIASLTGCDTLTPPWCGFEFTPLCVSGSWRLCVKTRSNRNGVTLTLMGDAPAEPVRMISHVFLVGMPEKQINLSNQAEAAVLGERPSVSSPRARRLNLTAAGNLDQPSARCGQTTITCDYAGLTRFRFPVSVSLLPASSSGLLKQHRTTRIRP
jgi:hypothetical protein